MTDITHLIKRIEQKTGLRRSEQLYAAHDIISFCKLRDIVSRSDFVDASNHFVDIYNEKTLDRAFRRLISNDVLVNAGKRHAIGGGNIYKLNINI